MVASKLRHSKLDFFVGTGAGAKNIKEIITLSKWPFLLFSCHFTLLCGKYNSLHPTILRFTAECHTCFNIWSSSSSTSSSSSSSDLMMYYSEWFSEQCWFCTSTNIWKSINLPSTCYYENQKFTCGRIYFKSQCGRNQFFLQIRISNKFCLHAVDPFFVRLGVKTDAKQICLLENLLRFTELWQKFEPNCIQFLGTIKTSEPGIFALDLFLFAA